MADTNETPKIDSADCSCETTCDNCNQCASCDPCQCVKCPTCEKMRESVCDSCGNCTDDSCCECLRCEHCGQVAEELCSICHNCQSHCEHYKCSHCKEWVENTCGNCGRCTEGCCECFYCGECGESCDSGCGECDRCRDCCSCEQGPRCQQKFKILRPENLTGYKENFSKRPISIELELACVQSEHKLLSWAYITGAGIVEDGSLPDSGCEINTNPAAGDLFIEGARGLAAVLKDAGAEVNDSCGLHVHVDASDYTQFDLRRLIMFWSLVERPMYDLAGKKRIENSYCKPSAFDYVSTLNAGAIEWRKELTVRLYKDWEGGKDIRALKGDKYGSSRYYALNLHSFFFRKTIEFRLHEARLESHVLEHWPMLCAHVVDKAMSMRECELIALAKSNASGQKILEDLMPLKLRRWVHEQLTARYTARRTHGTVQIVENLLNDLDRGRDLLAGFAEPPVERKTKKRIRNRKRKKHAFSMSEIEQDMLQRMRVGWVPAINSESVIFEGGDLVETQEQPTMDLQTLRTAVEQLRQNAIAASVENLTLTREDI